MPSQGFDKRSCLARAEQLLGRQDDNLLRYVCLELRFCLEAIAYQKLRTYSKRLPEAILNTWQPPQAVRALLEFEPLSDQDFTIRIRRESAPGVPTGELIEIGTHRTLRLSWLRKTYNKLGHYLHIPTMEAQASKSVGPTRQDLENIITELRPVVDSAIDSSLAAVLEFECSVCHLISLSNIEAAKKRQKVVCLNPNCQAEFFPEFGEGDDAKLQLISSLFDCLSCGEQIRVENRKLDVGYEFFCQQCGSRHQIVSRQWEYGIDVSNS